MTPTEMLLRANPAASPRVSAHVFKVGDAVLMRPSFQYASATGIYRVTALLPARDGEPQYRIRCDEERFERVAPQGDLSLVAASTQGVGKAAAVGTTFSH